MPESIPMVSVIIAAHNAQETLGRQLSALVRQDSDVHFQTVVVLNRSTDHSRDVAGEFESELDLLIVEANARGSAAYARNVGAEMSLGECLLFCDSDDQADLGWVKAMSSPLLAGTADLVGANIQVHSEATRAWIFDKYYKYLDGPELQWYQEAIRYPLGASLGITRTAFESVGGFDEEFVGAGSEEIDLTLRLLRGGFRVGEAPNAVMNYQPRRTLQSVILQRKNYAAGEAMLLSKEGKLPPFKPFFKQVWSATRAAAVATIRRREFQPMLPAMAFLDSMLLDRAFNRHNLEGKCGDEIFPLPSSDFVAAPRTPIIGGLAFACAPRVAGWWARSGVEASSLQLLDSLLPEGGTFVDAGANIGIFSVAAAQKVGNGGQVIAFEVNPAVCELLEANAKRHGVCNQIRVENIALGAESGEQFFIQYSNDLVSSFYSAPPSYHPGHVVSQHLVRVTSLDSACPLDVDVLKIDVEGAEHSVLRGATRMLTSEHPPVVILEWNPSTMRAARTRGSDLLSHFPLTDWSFWLIEDDPESITHLTPFGRQESEYFETDTTGWYLNIVAVPKKARPDAMNEIQRFIGRYAN